MNTELDNPQVEAIMKGFEEIWPKILWFDPDVEPYYTLMQNVYAQGVLNTFQYMEERTEESKIVH